MRRTGRATVVRRHLGRRTPPCSGLFDLGGGVEERGGRGPGRGGRGGGVGHPRGAGRGRVPGAAAAGAVVAAEGSWSTRADRAAPSYRRCSCLARASGSVAPASLARVVNM